jgi:hypothetical protein
LGGEKKMPTFLYVIKLDQGVYTLETSIKSSEVKAKWDGTRASFILDLDFESKMLYQSVNSPTTQEIKQQIKEQLVSQLLEEVTLAIRTSVDYDCDYLYFSEPFRIAYAGVYEQLDWHDTFEKADFTVNLTVALKEHPAFDYSQ